MSQPPTTMMTRALAAGRNRPRTVAWGSRWMNRLPFTKKEPHDRQHSSQAQAEGEHQGNPQAYRVIGHGRKQKEERRWARQDTSPDSQTQQRSPGDQRTIGSRWQVRMIVLMDVRMKGLAF